MPRKRTRPVETKTITDILKPEKDILLHTEAPRLPLKPIPKAKKKRKTMKESFQGSFYDKRKNL